jgi:hypothetical protein
VCIARHHKHVCRNPFRRLWEAPGFALLPNCHTTPEQLFRAIGKLRKDARDEIDRLIRFLDETENHMELEPDDPAEDGGDDEDSDTDEDSDPAEPALGSLDGQTDQTQWAAGGRADLELDGAESGIGDLDGLLEQVECGGWQGPRTGMG